eukprot:GILJ01016214.1.p1 GENE.GILJ01016214.1~~GILJ01016214.1.p1  ORF type:complete len:561 (+),score=100.81 GILJ01016214.1:65-1747(+)
MVRTRRAANKKGSPEKNLRPRRSKARNPTLGVAKGGLTSLGATAFEEMPLGVIPMETEQELLEKNISSSESEGEGEEKATSAKRKRSPPRVARRSKKAKMSEEEEIAAIEEAARQEAEKELTQETQPVSAEPVDVVIESVPSQASRELAKMMEHEDEVLCAAEPWEAECAISKSTGAERVPQVVEEGQKAHHAVAVAMEHEDDMLKAAEPWEAEMTIAQETSTPLDDVTMIARETAPKGYTEENPVTVFVDGVFDLFHAGHAQQLERAKKLYPYTKLVVGIASDEDTCLYKGEPLLSQKERAEAVRHCKWVDEVILSPPWFITEEFLRARNVDFVAYDPDFLISDDNNETTSLMYEVPRQLGILKEFERRPSMATNQLVVRILNRYNRFASESLGKGYSEHQLRDTFASNHFQEKLIRRQSDGMLEAQGYSQPVGASFDRAVDLVRDSVQEKVEAVKETVTKFVDNIKDKVGNILGVESDSTHLVSEDGVFQTPSGDIITSLVQEVDKTIISSDGEIVTSHTEQSLQMPAEKMRELGLKPGQDSTVVTTTVVEETTDVLG